MPNRLARETSPYLLQHKDNPVDWYPWGDEALSRARTENRPILLSVGYSACHWCHVMEHESFENPAIATLMNENFVCIKVDREERPDLDQIYQNVAQAMTRGGGWPLTVFLSPDLKPFYGGTYFPPDDRYGRPGFARVLQALSEAYQKDPGGISENSTKLMSYISYAEGGEGAPAPAAGAAPAELDSLLERSARWLEERVDFTSGGLGGAPKFPNPMAFAFLLRMGKTEAVFLTLEKMARGGIYDQLGGGFHRYSVDAYWSVPHFEKMLYDNALLLRLYAEALLSNAPELTPALRELFADVLSETTGYLLREMRSPEGAFYSAQDADSEGEEGKFFVWGLGDLEAEGGLSSDEARVFALRYGVTAGGNFEHGKTVLHATRTVAEAARDSGMDETATRLLLTSARAKLLTVRSRRVAPGRDDKVLTAWNALAVSGLVWAAKALEAHGRREEAGAAREAAASAYAFLRERVAQPGGRLFATFQGGKPRFNAYLDDYAFLAMAALELARGAEDTEEGVAARVRDAEEWIGTLLTRFDDPTGGFYFTSDDHEQLIHRPRTVHDQAIPSGTSVALGALAALAEIAPDGGRYARELETRLKRILPQADRNPFGFGELLCAARLHARGPVAVSGPDAPAAGLSPEVFRKPAEKGQRGTLVCHRGTCSLPLTDAGAVRREVAARLPR